ncbi:MAG: molybdopterin molybdenumtransferase MoeA, partial [Hydrogenimonas sp.]|nr:molybdopterin molybdenumtransferase MoeA [Hydrogenimonas sp.]
TLFEKVNIKPGKPTTVGRIDKTWIVNLPGNPTAAAINFELFARTIIERLKGSAKPYIAAVESLCEEDISLKPGKFTALLGRFDGKSFTALKKQGPGMVSPLKEADGFIITEPQTSFIKSGSKVKMIPIRFLIGQNRPADIFTSGKSYSFEM